MNKYIERAMSWGIERFFTQEKTVSRIRTLQKIATKTGIYEFDIFNIPNKQHVLAHNHGFKLFGKVADMYILGPGANRPVVGLFYYKLFERPVYKKFIKAFRGIPTNKLRCLRNYIKNGEIVALAPSGPEHIPNLKGELGAAWIAKTFEMPLIPTLITQKERYVSIKPLKEIYVPKDATKKDLRSITDEVMNELGY